MVLTEAAFDHALTEEQQAVVDSGANAVVVIAPAGTGKTEILARRAERFLNDPANEHSRVLVITYTTRAAAEFEARLQERVAESMNRVSADTIHSFAHTMLSTHGSHVGLSSDFRIINTIEDRADLLAHYDHNVPPDGYPELFRRLDLARANDAADPRLKSWRGALHNSGALDFSEMISKAAELLDIEAVSRMARVVYGLVIVDEAQNLTKQQYRLITSLIGPPTMTGLSMVPTMMLGDPNQSVTGFAGGDSTLMNQFAHDYGAKRFELTQNFRSSKCLAALERVVSQELGSPSADSGVDAEQAAEGAVSVHEFHDEQSEGAFVARWATRLLEEGLPAEAVPCGEQRRVRPEDIAVLARHSAALNAASAAMKESGHEVARSHNDEDLMATTLGAVTINLMRLHSPRHQMAAQGALARELRISNPAHEGSDNPVIHLAAALAARADDHLEVLVPLLGADSPQSFIEALPGCELPETAPCEMLAGWGPDQQVISDTWNVFAEMAPLHDRTWSRFAAHFDRVHSARDFGTGIRLLTVHKAQGREFRAVAVLGMNNGQFPDFRAMTSDSIRAETQAFYVAVTRASRVLLLTRALNRPTRFGDRATEPSPFLQFVQQADKTQQP